MYRFAGGGLLGCRPSRSPRRPRPALSTAQKDFENRSAVEASKDAKTQRLLSEMREHLATLEQQKANEDPRLSFTTPAFREAQRTFAQGYKTNFGRPIEYALVKDHPWSMPALRKLDRPIKPDGTPWAEDKKPAP